MVKVIHISVSDEPNDPLLGDHTVTFVFKGNVPRGKRRRRVIDIYRIIGRRKIGKITAYIFFGVADNRFFVSFKQYFVVCVTYVENAVKCAVGTEKVEICVILIYGESTALASGELLNFILTARGRLYISENRVDVILFMSSGSLNLE